MRYGQPYGSGWGNPENHVEYVFIKDRGAYYDVTFKPSANLGDSYFAIYRNGKIAKKTYAAEGEVVTVSIAVGRDSYDGRVNFAVIRDGHFNDLFYFNSAVLPSFDLDAKRVTLEWNWQYESQDGYDGYAQNWVFDNLKYADTERVVDAVTKGRVYFDLSIVAGVATVTVYNANKTLCTGTGATSTTLTLDGDITGTVDILGVPDGEYDGNEVFVRWPAQMEIMRDIVDPPSTVRDTVAFNRRDMCTWTEGEDITVTGTHYYRIRPISDTGDTGDQSATVTAVIQGVPEAPTSLVYSSGNAAATTVSWTYGSPVGVTFNVYAQPMGWHTLDVETPFATVVGATSVVLPAQTGYPGTARFLVRASVGGVEEKNLDCQLAVEYDAAGSVVLARPNPCSIDKTSFVWASGLQLTITGTYDSDEEASPAVGLKLYTFGVPVATQAFNGELNGFDLATFVYTFPATGWYEVTMYAYDASGVLSATPSETVWIYASDVNAAAHTFTARTTRG